MVTKGEFRTKDKTLSEQFIALKRKYPNFEVILGKSELKAVGEFQPTARSKKYKVEILYHASGLPVISVLEPKLITNFKGSKIPHVYKGDKLCLFKPNYYEFTPNMLLSETVFPWISLWLYFYELWHVTDKWLGGGEHPRN